MVLGYTIAFSHSSCCSNCCLLLLNAGHLPAKQRIFSSTMAAIASVDAVMIASTSLSPAPAATVAARAAARTSVLTLNLQMPAAIA